MNRVAATLFLLPSLTLLALGLQDPIKDFETLATNEANAAQDAYQKKDFKKAIEAMEKIAAAYRALTPEQQKQEGVVPANIDYNLACYYSRAKDRKQAIEHFKASVDEGYKDYGSASKDTDLGPLHDSPIFKAALEHLRAVGDYPFILAHAGGYDHAETCTKPGFAFEPPSDDYLKKVADLYNVEMIAGKGDDLSKVLRLMRWVHLSANHDGSNDPKVNRNAIDLLNYAHREKKGLNCRCLAITLNDLYLAAGFKSRYITCLPKDTTDPDCHVIDSVYVPSLKKWIWMDPSFCSYFKDEKGNFLGIREVRERIIQHKPLVASAELNWNGTQMTADYYKNYMAKNLYWLEAPVRSASNYESEPTPPTFIALVPSDFKQDQQRGAPQKSGPWSIVYTSDDAYFWEKL